MSVGNKIFDLTGETFGRLEVVSFEERLSNATLFNCKCICGNHVIVSSNHLRTGRTQSCGCLQRERASKSSKIHGHANKMPEYFIWKNMKGRCYNKNDKRYKDWGGRGIVVCERWHSFENFIADMGKRPSSKHSIDRFPNNDGNYEPENCRWATEDQQNRNKRSNVYLEYNNERLIMADWAKKLGIDVRTLFDRLKSGWSVEKTLSTPVIRRLKNMI